MKKLLQALLISCALGFGIVTITSNIAYAGTVASAGQYVDDATLTTQIKAKLAKDKLINTFNVKVTTVDGKVTLSGNVDNKNQYEKIIEIVESTDGVEDVNADELTVKHTTSALEDSLITGKVQGLLLRNSISTTSSVKFRGVHVETKNGIVYLSGFVDSKDQKENILKLVKPVKGVKDVKETLRVKP